MANKEPSMDLKDDPLYQVGQELKGQPGGAFYIRPPNWAQLGNDIDRGWRVGKWFWNNLAAFFIIYGLSTTGAGLAWLFWKGAVAAQQGHGFFNLGLGWGTIDALVFVIAIACGAATIVGVIWAFRELFWVSQIIALFFYYNLVVWAIHDFQFTAYPVGANFFCWALSFLIEGGIGFWRRRMD